MSYYWFNRQKLLQKAKDKYHNREGKEKAVEYYLANKEAIKEKGNNKYKNLSQKQEQAKKKHSKNRDKK